MKPAKHGRDHCPGGEDPIPCLSGAIGFAYIIWDQSSVSITPGLWTGIDSADTFNQPFNEGFVSDPDPYGFAVDLTNDTAHIDWAGSAQAFNYPLVLVSAWVQWASTTFTDGDEIGVGIILGSGGTYVANFRFINVIPVTAHDTEVENQKISLNVIVPGSYNKHQARVQVFHSSSAAKDCANAFLSVTGLMTWGGTFFA